MPDLEAQFNSGHVMVDTTYRELYRHTFDVASTVTLEIDNNSAGGAALTGFRIQIRLDEDGDWHDYIEDDDLDKSQFDCRNVIFSSGDPQNLASGSSDLIIFVVLCQCEIRYQAKSGTEGNVLIRGNFQAGVIR